MLYNFGIHLTYLSFIMVYWLAEAFSGTCTDFRNMKRLKILQEITSLEEHSYWRGQLEPPPPPTRLLVLTVAFPVPRVFRWRWFWERTARPRASCWVSMETTASSAWSWTTSWRSSTWGSWDASSTERPRERGRDTCAPQTHTDTHTVRWECRKHTRL